MSNNNIINNYPPQWEGKTKEGVLKRIFVILGTIKNKTYRRLIDSEGYYLLDNEGYRLMVEREY